MEFNWIYFLLRSPWPLGQSPMVRSGNISKASAGINCRNVILMFSCFLSLEVRSFISLPMFVKQILACIQSHYNPFTLHLVAWMLAASARHTQFVRSALKVFRNRRAWNAGRSLSFVKSHLQISFFSEKEVHTVEQFILVVCDNQVLAL